MKQTVLSIIFILLAQLSWAQFRLCQGDPITIACSKSEDQVVHTALQLLARDYQAVFSDSIHFSTTEGNIIVATLDNDSLWKAMKLDTNFLRDKKQSFLLKVLEKGKLLILGSDAHGTAYGLMELSRLIGVSPWEWWADVPPSRKAAFELPAEYVDYQSPSVEFRGIFINDEDWGLMPWSSLNYEPWYKAGRIGPRTNEKIFELMLRLRANYYWPAMHECTQPFFLTEGNREIARKYGIYIGGSHCEPMASSTAVEWGRRGKGEYDYVNNAQEVLRFWEERVKEVAGQEILYTIGMRGVHDGQMNGAKTVEEQKAVLDRVIADQRELLRKYVNQDITQVPQVFIPYKEVLDVYNAGLQVPDDVTLMWCDDNYGYIRHFPTAKELARKGGNGIYYHVSYWGRPHDYLWLGTFSPALLCQQMMEAYDRGIQKMWILNVGDIKPNEYQTELFLDMAWNIQKVKDEGVTAHLGQFLQREFGESIGKELLPVMQEHYRLSYIRKPEFMGNTRVEEPYTSDYHIVKDLPWNRQFMNRRLVDYQRLSDRAELLSRQLPANRQDAYFQLVKYPVQAAAQMNKKLLMAQFARHGEKSWQESDAAYDSIVALTHIYNVGIHNQGKWHHMMDCQPRKLPVFEPVDRVHMITPIAIDRIPFCQWNAMECTKGTPVPCELLGYEGKAARIEKNKALVFTFDTCPSDSVEVQICLLPNHPVEDGTSLRVSVSLDEEGAHELSYQTKGRSEEWKLNVLNNQAVRKVVFPMKKKEKHRLVVTAIDEGVVLDQIMIYTKE